LTGQKDGSERLSPRRDTVGGTRKDHIPDEMNRAPIDAPDVGFLVIDADDAIEYASNEILNFYQSLDSTNQITGMRFKDFLSLLLENGEFAGKIAADQPGEWIEARLRQHRTDDAACEEHLSDGRVIQVKEQALGDGRFVAQWTEVTEFMRLREQVEDIMESSQDGFALWDQKNCLVAFNKVFQTLFDGSAQTVQRGDSFLDVLTTLINGQHVELDCEAEQWVRDYLADRRLPSFSRTLAFKDGRHFLVRERRIRNGGITSLFIDITDLKHKENALLERTEMLERMNYELETSRMAFEEQGRQLAGLAEKLDESHLETLKAKRELQRANDELEQKVEERTADLKTEIEKREAVAQELRKANLLAKTASEMKTGFLASMSHELRTPLNAIVGFSEVMDAQIMGEIDSEIYRDYVSNIVGSARQLMETIEHVLDISAISSDKLSLDEGVFDIRDALEVALRLLRSRAEAHRMEIKETIAPDVAMIRGDERRIKQILLNLVANAIKFSKAKSEVLIDIYRAPKDGLKIEVTDHGIGMTAEEVRYSQMAFGQVDPMVSRDHDGSGLGLPLARALVELHGGRLDIQSEVDKGTTVTVTLPERRIIG